MKITLYQGKLYIDDTRVVSVILDKPTEAGTNIVTDFSNVRFEDLTLTEDEKRERVLAEAAKYLEKSKVKDGIRTNIELERQLQNVVIGSNIACGVDFKLGS